MIPLGEGGADRGVSGPKKGCVTLDKSFGFSEPVSFPLLKNRLTIWILQGDHEVEIRKER